MAVTDTSVDPRGGRIRRPAVAGLFYPDDPAELEQLVASLLARAPAEPRVPKAIIAPHAGYPFSGPVAARAYAALRAARDRIQRVVLLGPAHRVYFKGLALPESDHFATPLGNVAIDKEAAEGLTDLPQVTVMEAPHREEHSLEVHLPFLQQCLDRFRLVPLVVGEAPAADVAAVIERLWGGEETLIVISSDLSHYNDYTTAAAVDSQTVECIKNRRLEAIGPNQACGCMPIRGLLHILRERDLPIEVLDVRNSGDTAGPRDRVVGYGSFAVYSPAVLDEGRRDKLRAIARASIDNGLQDRGSPPIEPQEATGVLGEKRGVFVTLKLDGQLRGCIGNTEAERPLAEGVAVAAIQAAFHDPRFNALSPEEFERVELGISVLSPARPLSFQDEDDLLSQLKPCVDGVTIAKDRRRATFLPSVWEGTNSPQAFLQQLKQKAGIGPDEVPDEAWVYTAESF